MSRLGPFFFKYRNFLFPVVFLPVLLFTEPRAFLHDRRADAWLDAVGLLLLAAGQGLRVLVIGLAYIQRGGKDKQIYAASLVQEGIFAHSRNPLYLGNFAIRAGLILVHNGPWMYLVGVPFFAVAYASIIQAEERYLAERFGAEYAEYCKRVPRLFPRLRGLGRTIAGMRFQWRRVVRKEYGTLMCTGSGVLLLIARQSMTKGEPLGIRSTWPPLLAAWIVLGVAWVVARVLKKSGALKDAPSDAAPLSSTRVASQARMP